MSFLIVGVSHACTASSGSHSGVAKGGPALAHAHPAFIVCPAIDSKRSIHSNKTVENSIRTISN